MVCNTENYAVLLEWCYIAGRGEECSIQDTNI